MTKYCPYCKLELDTSLFSKNKDTKDGLNRQCKPCQKAYYKNNRPKIIARVKASYDRDRKKAYDAKRRKLKCEELRQYDRIRNARSDRIAKSREWIKNHPEHRRVTASKYAHKRRAAQLKATPPWYGELDDFVLQEALDLCFLWEACVGGKWELDHFIPLLGKNVCGLHAANNFQVVPEAYNRRKSNKFPYPEWRRVTSAPPKT
jgi:hypothetical protein